ncbi:MAG: sulfite exporter TauE/SafE family protein [Bdellovibrionales bacterium]|nr:sulfite exporter TauE/SafE family protein [Bdellovibrionales bacterium]NQZ17843.1 sulfite exporter TauE/SafE family protein [Bdellovibrionales bacterium]
MTETTVLTSGVALVFGLLHALEPGHGKTALMTYLASGKRTLGEGIFIALTSAITHSFAVLGIALASHYFLHHGAEGDWAHIIGDYLSYLSGGLIICLGVWIFFKNEKDHSHHSCMACNATFGHHHDRSHDHDHDHDHGHLVSKRSFLTSGLLGIATGIIPCPTVVVAYLSGLSTGNSLLGLQSVFLFALGMSISLVAVIVLFNMGALKVRDKVNLSFIPFSWNHAQGVIFVLIGLFTALYH